MAESKKQYQSSKEPHYGYCGASEFHVKKTCPAGKPGVFCKNCYGDNHFANVCRGQKDRYKRAWLARRNKGSQPDSRQTDRRPVNALSGHVEATEQSSSDDEGIHHQYAVSHYEYTLCLDKGYKFVHAVDNASHKLYTDLSLSTNGDRFTKLKFQVDTTASCNTIPYALIYLHQSQHYCPTQGIL